MENKELFYTANIGFLLVIKKHLSDKYYMKRIKSFSALSESASDTMVYTTKLGGYASQGHPTLVDLYKEPEEIYGASVIGGAAEWTLDLRHRNWGIELGSEEARLISLRLELEIENKETGEPEEIEIEVAGADFNWESFVTEIHQFPLDLESIEITMNGSMDPKEWKIILHIGRIPEY